MLLCRNAMLQMLTKFCIKLQIFECSMEIGKQLKMFNNEILAEDCNKFEEGNSEPVSACSPQGTFHRRASVDPTSTQLPNVRQLVSADLQVSDTTCPSHGFTSRGTQTSNIDIAKVIPKRKISANLRRSVNSGTGAYNVNNPCILAEQGTAKDDVTFSTEVDSSGNKPRKSNDIHNVIIEPILSTFKSSKTSTNLAALFSDEQERNDSSKNDLEMVCKEKPPEAFNIVTCLSDASPRESNLSLRTNSALTLSSSASPGTVNVATRTSPRTVNVSTRAYSASPRASNVSSRVSSVSPQMQTLGIRVGSESKDRLYPSLEHLEDHKAVFGPSELRPDVIDAKVKKLCRVSPEKLITVDRVHNRDDKFSVNTTTDMHELLQRTKKNGEVRVCGEIIKPEVEDGKRVIFVLGEDDEENIKLTSKEEDPKRPLSMIGCLPQLSDTREIREARHVARAIDARRMQDTMSHQCGGSDRQLSRYLHQHKRTSSDPMKITQHKRTSSDPITTSQHWLAEAVGVVQSVDRAVQTENDGCFSVVHR